MFCARCRKTFSKDERITWTVLHGMKNQVPTCFDDRLCEVKKSPVPVIIVAKVKPAIVIMPFKPKPKKKKNRDVAREMASKFVRPWK